MVRDSKLYDILEIKTDADDNEIKKAYKKLSFKWHPDKNTDNTEVATAKFQEISEAYSILSDPSNKERYDREGYDSMKNSGNGNMPNPQDIFSQFFGGMGGPNFFGGNFFNQGQQPQTNSMEHCMVEQEVTLEDLFSQKTIVINYKQKNYCKKCNGNGTKDGNNCKCNGCNGSGKKIQVIQRGNMIQQMIGACNDCNGTGESISKNNKCDECNGVKYLVKDKTIELPLNKNICNGQQLVLEQKGNVYKNGKTNVVVVIREKPHPLYKRNGKDLHYNMKLRIFQTLFGFSKNITHLDGRNLHIKFGPIKKMDSILKIKNEGMGGDLYIHLNTSIPNLEKLDEGERIALKKLLIKTNMTEYNKEIALAKIPTIHPGDIEEIHEDNEKEEEVPHTGHHNGQPEGVQCAQQ